MTYDRARPLHVSTLAKVRGNLTVRRARERRNAARARRPPLRVDAGVCVIADDHGVESLARHHGRRSSGCDENTTDVLIDRRCGTRSTSPKPAASSASIPMRVIASSAASLRLQVPGLELATRLVMEICGGFAVGDVVVGKTFGDDRVIEFPLTEVKRLAGIDVPLVEMRHILTHLGFMMAAAARR